MWKLGLKSAGFCMLYLRGKDRGPFNGQRASVSNSVMMCLRQGIQRTTTPPAPRLVNEYPIHGPTGWKLCFTLAHYLVDLFATVTCHQQPRPGARPLTCGVSSECLGTRWRRRRSGGGATVTCHQQPRPLTCRRLLRVPRHEKLWNYVTWPAWENSNVFLFNWCLYSSEISDCKSP